jgi:hypothetical protein
MRDPMARRRRLTDGTRWRTFMRLLRLDGLMASYTNMGAPELGLVVVDLDLRHGLRGPKKLTIAPFDEPPADCDC